VDQLLALLGRQTVLAPPAVEVGLGHPVTQRFRGNAQVFGRDAYLAAALTNQPHDLSTELGRVLRGKLLRHSGPPCGTRGPKGQGVHVTGSTPAQERGQTRPGINGKIVKALELTVPPLAEQNEIVRLVDTLLAEADSIEQRLGLVAARIGKVTMRSLTRSLPKI
jgi:hypothetical protein